MNEHWSGGQSSFVGLCGMAGERARRRARLLITAETSPFPAALALALILLLMGPRVGSARAEGAHTLLSCCPGCSGIRSSLRLSKVFAN